MTTSKWLLSLVVAMMIGVGSASLLRADDKAAPAGGTTATAGEDKEVEKPKAPKKEDDEKPEAPKAPKAPENN